MTIGLSIGHNSYSSLVSDEKMLRNNAHWVGKYTNEKARSVCSMAVICARTDIFYEYAIPQRLDVDFLILEIS
jgi:hypothetical protein